MNKISVGIRLGSAAIAVLIAGAVFYALGLASRVHIGEPRAGYNDYFRGSLAVATWLLIFSSALVVRKYDVAQKGTWLSGLLRAAASGLVLGYVSGLIAYIAMLTIMAFVDHRNFRISDGGGLVVLVLQPVLSLAWLFGVSASLVNYSMLTFRRTGT